MEERDVGPPDAVEGDGRLPPLVLVLARPGPVEGRVSHLKANAFSDRLRAITIFPSIGSKLTQPLRGRRSFMTATYFS